MWSLLLHEVSIRFAKSSITADSPNLRCALNRFIKSPKCYACGTATGGLFNKAERILAKLEAKNKKKREEKGIVDEPEDDGGIEIGGADSDVEGGDSAPESD